MFGKIKFISDDNVVVELNRTGNVIPNLMNLHVVFENQEGKLLGEVKNITDDSIKISLLGEFINDKFIAGTIKKPTLDSALRIINPNELDIIMGSNNNNSLYIGKSPLYQNRNIFADINDLFSNHLAIFGNSGSGKSCAVSRVIQNIFLNPNFLSYYANLFIFDAYGEYKNAFKDINKFNPNYQYKFVTTKVQEPTDIPLQIPIYLLTNDDIALLLNADNHAQLTIIERTMKLVKLFSQTGSNIENLKDHLIAKAIQSVLYSNKTISAKRDDIFNILYSCPTPNFNMNIELQGIGYTRNIYECFKVDSKGEFRESILIDEYIASHINEGIESSITPPELAYYNLDDLLRALNFTLISEGFLNNGIMEDSSIILKVRLNALINSQNAKIFNVMETLTLDQYISNLVLQNNKKCQIVNFNLEDIDDNLAKVIVKILSKMVFDFARNRKVRASIPFHLIIEEAHRYVTSDNDGFLIGYNIFDRIAKEGRKYGVIINLVSQRPVDISETVVSQMSNFLILKMTHPRDLDYIEKMLPNISIDIIEKLTSLQSGTLVAFGNAFKIPLLIRMELPNPLPYSSNCDIVDRWKGNTNTSSNNN